jgi:hypothetical protein
LVSLSANGIQRILVFILAIALEAKIHQDYGDEIVEDDDGVIIPLDIYEGNALPWVHFALFAVLSKGRWAYENRDYSAGFLKSDFFFTNEQRKKIHMS